MDEKQNETSEVNVEEKKSKNHIGHTIEMNKISDKTKKSFKTRTITAFALLLVCVPGVVLGGWFFFGIILAVLCFATYEFIHVLRTKKYPKFVNIFTFIMTISLSFWSYVKNFIMTLYTGKSFYEAVYSVGNNFLTTDMIISTIGMAILILVLYLFSMLYDDFTVGDVGYLANTAIIITLGIQAFFFLRYAPLSVTIKSTGKYFDYNGDVYCSMLLFFYVVIGTFGTDIGAYAFGVLFGKNKINPRISPNKTWEGFWGGIVGSTVLSLIFGLIPIFNGVPLLYGVLDASHWYLVVILSLIMPFVSTLGDFIFSAIKRYYVIKDFGKVLPGHGGVLDRIDSLLVTSTVVALFIITFVLYSNGGVFVF